jgi:4-alpha-glucanotransferase
VFVGDRARDGALARGGFARRSLLTLLARFLTLTHLLRMQTHPSMNPYAEEGSRLVRYYAFDGFLRRQERWRAAGLALPVFSIRNNRDALCGQFSDLPALGSWCKSCGFSLLQLLPVCDTSVKNNWRDSYPYSSLCVFALHPMYLDVSVLGLSAEAVGAEMAKNKPDSHDVDYEVTMAFKLGTARQAFVKFGEQDLQSEEYEAFEKSNGHWLMHYAVFCFLRDFFKTAEHWTWGVYAKPSAEMINHLSHPDREWYSTIRFHCYLQFKLHQQLYNASSELKRLGVVLKGDLPIGVDKCSVDTWQHPSLFRMHTNTGAPPDYFDPKGQNWGFPTYNWEAMSKDNYAWWRKRLAHMSQYFQAYRIDHILGFFRIWELPRAAKTGILGRYRPSIGYSRAELERQGLWDIDRLADPFITDELLHELFDDPELELEVKERFLEPSPGNRYRFKGRYNSESAMFSLKCRPGLPDATTLDTERIRTVLILLSQNVCLIKDQDDPHNNFYPRFNLMDTTSFQYLHDEHWKNTLRSMHEESFFGPRSDSMWCQQALETLPMMLSASEMLVCGEDLGFIPPCVHPIMEELGIVGLRIQRMPSEQGAEFGDPEHYGYMTVASPSSHDTTNFRAWYREDDGRRYRFCELFGLPDGEGPGATCSPDTVRAVVRQHLNSPSMLAVFSIQDVIGMSRNLPQRDPDEETINVPSNPEHYWRYRMHVSVADLEEDGELRNALRAMIGASGRTHTVPS